jgi:hypothetical protein
MTLFQKLVILILVAFLAVFVYDRVHAYRRKSDARETAKEKKMFEDYDKCEESLPYPGSQASKERIDSWLKARSDCTNVFR